MRIVEGSQPTAISQMILSPLDDRSPGDYSTGERGVVGVLGIGLAFQRQRSVQDFYSLRLPERRGLILFSFTGLCITMTMLLFLIINKPAIKQWQQINNCLDQDEWIGQYSLQQFQPMGNRQCEQCQQVKNSNKAYGQFQVCQLEGKQLAIIEKKLELTADLPEKVQKQLTKRTKITCKHIVRLHKFDILPSEYDLTVTLYYEYMPRTLREYLEESALRGEELTERQLFSIIYGVETGLQTLADMGIQHGCINLQTILFKNGLFKITDISSTTYLTSYQLVLQGNRDQFLSQKLLNNLSLSMMKAYEFNITDDLFSLGLIILMIIAGGQPQNFYTWKKTQKFLVGTFNMRYIQHCFKLMSRNFSSKLCNKVKSYVLLNRQERHIEQQGTLSSELQDLSDDMSRVLNKIKFGFSSGSGNAHSRETTMRNSLFHTPHRH